MRMDHALRWIIPIVKTRKVIYDIPIDERTASEMDIMPRMIQEERETENQLQRQWYDGSLTYAQYMTNLLEPSLYAVIRTSIHARCY